MSDGITEARKGTYFSGPEKMTKEKYDKEIELFYERQLENIPIETIEKFLEKKKSKIESK